MAMHHFAFDALASCLAWCMEVNRWACWCWCVRVWLTSARVRMRSLGAASRVDKACVGGVSLSIDGGGCGKLWLGSAPASLLLSLLQQQLAGGLCRPVVGLRPFSHP